jgi:hypothetical protein
MGIDGFLRTYCYIYGDWFKIPSLYLGFKVLQEIYFNSDIKYFTINKIKNTVYPCQEAKQILTFLPPSKDFINVINLCNNIFDVFNLKGE